MRKQAAVAVVLLVVGLGFGCVAYHIWGAPSTTPDQRESIRTVQLNFVNAQNALNSSPEYKACLDNPPCKAFLGSQVLANYIQAQTNVQNSVQAVFSQAKADPAVWELDPTLHFSRINKSVLNAPPAPSQGPPSTSSNPAATPNAPASTPPAPAKK